MLSLLFIVSAAFAQDHTPYVSCPATNVIYDGRAACPDNCVAIPPGSNIRLMRCQGGALVVDSAKKTAHDKKIQDEADAKAARDAKIDELKRSTNPEVRALIQLLEEKK